MAIKFGSEAVFKDSTTGETKVIKLSSTTIVVADFNYSADTITLRVGTISGKSISYGTATTISSGLDLSSAGCDIAALDSTHFVLVYRDNQYPYYYIQSRIGTVSGTTISLGSTRQASTSQNYYVKVAALSSTSFVLLIQTVSQRYAILNSVSGTTITQESWTYLNNSRFENQFDVKALSSTSFIMACRAPNIYGYYGYATAYTISGTTITEGSAYQFGDAAVDFVNISVLSSTKAVISYKDQYNYSGKGTSIVASISGTTISYGTATVFNDTGNTIDIASDALDSSNIVITYKDYANSSKGTVIIGTIDGTDISFSDEAIFNDNTTSYTSVAALDDETFAITFVDGGNSDYGTGIIGYLAAEATGNFFPFLIN